MPVGAFDTLTVLLTVAACPQQEALPDKRDLVVSVESDGTCTLTDHYPVVRGLKPDKLPGESDALEETLLHRVQDPQFQVKEGDNSTPNYDLLLQSHPDAPFVCFQVVASVARRYGKLERIRLSCRSSPHACNVSLRREEGRKQATEVRVILCMEGKLKEHGTAKVPHSKVEMGKKVPSCELGVDGDLIGSLMTQVGDGERAEDNRIIETLLTRLAAKMATGKADEFCLQLDVDDQIPVVLFARVYSALGSERTKSAVVDIVPSARLWTPSEKRGRFKRRDDD